MTASSVDTVTPPFPDVMAAIVIGAGFAGIGMAIALGKAGVHDILLLEKSGDLGGVWRDNTYPGAACDVPSHLYSFSFAPNPTWSRKFSGQAEIRAYLERCAAEYDVTRKIRFGAEVVAADWNAALCVWRVTLADGANLDTRVLISAVGILGRPALPNVPGLDRLIIPAFHSARWRHEVDLAGKRVAVIGTGASAVQFVPIVAEQAASLTVFQRSPPWIIPRPDRAYSATEQARFAKHPWLMRLHRAGIYAHYESRALGFTRLQGLMTVAVGKPFQKMLDAQVPDPALRKKLAPDYPIGCKRILISSDYLAALARPNVEVVTEPIRTLTENGVETADGRHREIDAVIYGTGFTATEFLAPMRITGREGRDLNAAWRDGARAYFGLSVPGFPNFFMLYGPNTNLSHNSIIYMLESQIEHVMRCWRHMHSSGATSVEVETDAHDKQDASVQRQLATSVWAGCRSWYVDAKGHNSTSWPGFTFAYRWLTRRGSLSAYRFTASTKPSATTIFPGSGRAERTSAAFLRGFLRLAFRRVTGSSLGATTQRRIVAGMAPLTPGVGGVLRTRRDAGGVPTETVAPRTGTAPGVILYLHGGAFVLGSPAAYRAITTRLAVAAKRVVWAPDYRLAPEHPYPAAIDDALACWRFMLASGLRADEIVLAGDSAGGALVLALALRLRAAGAALPAGLAMISPVTDPGLSGPTLVSKADIDPMIRRAWIEQGLAAYACPPEASEHRPLETSLAGLPPMLVQVGDEEILLSDSTRLADHAAACGVPCRLEVYAERWHVFHLQAVQLASARSAIRHIAGFADERLRLAKIEEGENRVGIDV